MALEYGLVLEITMARYNQTAIQDMLDGLRAAKAQIDALTKERDEARSEMHRQRELWGEKCNELADANERIAALVSVIQDADSWMSLLWHRGKPDDLSVRLKIEKTLGDLRRISNGENISKVINQRRR